MKTRVSTAGYCLTGISKTVVPGGGYLEASRTDIFISDIWTEMLIDSHSHIDGAEFQLDIDEAFARMKEAEVGGALVAGTSLQDYERGLKFRQCT